MAVNYVRVSFSAKDLKKDVGAVLNKSIPPLQKNKALANELAREYGNIVTRYVPRSTAGVSHHHLQTFQVSDGRVMWYRAASRDIPALGITKGEEIADLLYQGPLFPGQVFRKRSNGGTQYGTHKPRSHWDNMVRPGKRDWKKFVEVATPIIRKYYKL